MTLNETLSGFIDFFERENNSVVLTQLLKKTSLVSLNEGKAVLTCENNGMKLLLESKKGEISAFFSRWIGSTVICDFLIKEKKIIKTEQVDVPLLNQNTKIKVAINRAGLQTKYTFENFAVSSSNQIAFSAAQKVAENPGGLYNPLFIYGPVGVGKTHLMQAIANKILENDVDKKILYCSSEEFTNELIELIRSKNTSDFRKKYRNLDVILVDDIQFIAGKMYVQEEFYHTFNTIIKNGGQVILTSEQPPKKIKKLEDRLQSRFSGGLTIDVQTPDFELRTAIVLIKANERNISIGIDTARLLAERVSDTRELEGRLLELYTKTLKNNLSITPDLIEGSVFKNETSFERIDPHSVVKIVSSFYNIKPSLLKSESRKDSFVKPRQVAMYILRNYLKLKLEEVCYVLKKKDHTTIIHGVDKITNLRLKDPQLNTDIERILKSLNY